MTTFTGPPAEREPGIGALTLGGFLREVTLRFGERRALLYAPPEGTRGVWTYNELWDQVRAVAKGLVAAGVSRGTRVAVLMGSRPEWVAAAWGAAMAGGVVVPFNTFVQRRELAHLLRHSDSAVVLTESALLRHRFVDDILGLCPDARTSDPGKIRSADFPFLRNIVAVDAEERGAVQSWQGFLASGAGIPDELVDGIMRETVPSEDGIILYSSGSTALPKGVLHRHRDAMLQCWRHGHREQYDPEDLVYGTPPLFWSAGFAAVMGATFACGACLLLPSYFNADHVLGLIEEERVTILLGVDNHMAELRAANERSARNLSSIRRDAYRLTGPLPPPGAPRPSHRASYGSSETFTSATGLPVDAPPDERATYGRLIAGSSMRILDTDTGKPLDVGQEGEIVLKGLTLMPGYVKVPPEQTFDDEGYFHTGDAGWIDEKGLLHYTGRLTNMIKTSGANVAPLEVEGVLMSHPHIQRAVVVGVPDPIAGELVVACVVLRPGAELLEGEISDYLRDKLSSFKIPRRILFFSSEEELPRTGSDKVNVPAVRSLVSELLAGGS